MVLVVSWMPGVCFVILGMHEVSGSEFVVCVELFGLHFSFECVIDVDDAIC